MSKMARLLPLRVRQIIEVETSLLLEGDRAAMEKTLKRPPSSREFASYYRSNERAIQNAIAKNVRTKCKEEYGKRYGFLEIVLVMALGAVVSWAIHKWLDRRFPDW